MKFVLAVHSICFMCQRRVWGGVEWGGGAFSSTKDFDPLSPKLILSKKAGIFHQAYVF